MEEKAGKEAGADEAVRNEENRSEWKGGLFPFSVPFENSFVRVAVMRNDLYALHTGKGG